MPCSGCQLHTSFLSGLDIRERGKNQVHFLSFQWWARKGKVVHTLNLGTCQEKICECSCAGLRNLLHSSGESRTQLGICAGIPRAGLAGGDNALGIMGLLWKDQAMGGWAWAERRGKRMEKRIFDRCQWSLRKSNLGKERTVNRTKNASKIH